MHIVRKKIIDSMADGALSSRFIKTLRLQLLKPEQIVSHLPDEGVIYDLGCGFGLCSVAAAFNPGTQVTGYDIDEERIRNNVDMFSDVDNLQFEVADIFEFAPPTPADAIMIIDSLHYFDPDTQTKIALALWQQVRPGGRLIIRDPVRDRSLKYAWNRFHEKTLVEVTKWTKSNSAKTWFLDKSDWDTLFAQLEGATLLERLACHTYLPYNDHLFVLQKADIPDSAAA
jgi:SAM-dependent methyltransferase